MHNVIIKSMHVMNTYLHKANRVVAYNQAHQPRMVVFEYTFHYEVLMFRQPEARFV
jgi:hypothetical protein